MPPDYFKKYQMYLDLPLEELFIRMSLKGEDGVLALIARHVYKERQQEEQRKHEAEMFKKQRFVTYLSTGVMALATLLAAIAAVYLAHTLQEVKTPQAIVSTTTQKIHIQGTDGLGLYVEKGSDKVPSQSPTTKKQK